MVGWTVAVPTIAGIFLGIWLDREWPVTFSWTLTLLVTGALLGSVMAWRWVLRS
jgi:ATP synthase protein I